MEKITQQYSRLQFLLAFIAWWLFWSLLQAFVMHRLDFSWSLAFTDSFISNTLLGIISLISILMYRYYQPGKGNRLLRLLYALAMSMVYCAVLSKILQLIFPLQKDYLMIVEKSMPLRFTSGFLFLSFFTVLNWLLTSLQDQQEQIRRHNEAERLIKEAELVKLRQQLQPHFLFNSLNSISALALTSPHDARQMIQQLSDFLRGTLRKEEEKTVLLSEEWQQLRLYLAIEKVRFGHRLQVEIEGDAASDQLQIPPLLLQPLVENAIKFGLYGTVGEVLIKVKACREENYLLIRIENPYDSKSRPPEGTGFGIRSIQRRLFLLYGRHDLLITQSDEFIFLSQIKIPQ